MMPHTNKEVGMKSVGLAAIIVIVTFGYAQAPDTLWTKTYGGIDTDWGEFVQECASGGFIVVGSTESFGAGSYDVYLVRTDANGDTLWTKTYGGAGWDWGFSVQECASGGFIIAGVTDSFGAGSYDVYLLRTDANGDTLWTKTCGGADGDWGYSVQECASGGFIIAGEIGSIGDYTDVYLVRTDANGDTLWTKTYGGGSYDFGNIVQECASGGFIIAGGTESFGSGGYDVYLLRTDANGDTLWTKTYGGANGDYGFSVQECTSGGFIITGWTESFGMGSEDVYLIRTDANGDTLWTKAYGGYAPDNGYSVQECASGGFVIAGETWLYGAGWHNNVYLVRTDANGDTLWTKNYGGANGDRCYFVQECASGGFILAGTTDSFGAGADDFYLIRVGPEGGIEENSETQVSSGLAVHPNPSLGNALIKYALPERADVSLMLYDRSGRLVKVLYSGTQDEGCHEVAIKQDGLSAGVYFIRFASTNSKAGFKATTLTILK
jgi:hypothetical protein